jgi:hypothetical protein
MSFPNNPSNGQTFTRFGKLFRFRGGTSSWEPVSSPIVATAFEPQASTKSVVAAADLPLIGNELGDVAFVEGTNQLYIWNGNGWFQIALVNTAPTITSGANPTYTLSSGGTPTIITLTANDPEGVPLTWSYQVTSGSLGGTTVTNNGNVFTITPSTNTADAGQFSLSFTASDGVNIATASSTFTLAFGPSSLSYQLSWSNSANAGFMEWDYGREPNGISFNVTDRVGANALTFDWPSNGSSGSVKISIADGDGVILTSPPLVFNYTKIVYPSQSGGFITSGGNGFGVTIQLIGNRDSLSSHFMSALNSQTRIATITKNI